MTWLYQVGFWLALGLASSELTIYADDFSRRFSSIYVQRSHQEKVAAYRLLASAYPQHPRVAEVYLELAAYLQIDADRAELYGKAVAASVPGTELWKRSQFALASSLARTTPERSDAILDEVCRVFPDPETCASRECFHAYRCLEKGDFDRAESHLAKMIELNSHRYESLLNHDQRFRLNQNVGSMVSNYLGRIAGNEKWSGQQKAARLREFMKKHSSRHAEAALPHALRSLRWREELVAELASGKLPGLYVGKDAEGYVVSIGVSVRNDDDIESVDFKVFSRLKHVSITADKLTDRSLVHLHKTLPSELETFSIHAPDLRITGKALSGVFEKMHIEGRQAD